MADDLCMKPSIEEACLRYHPQLPSGHVHDWVRLRCPRKIRCTKILIVDPQARALPDFELRSLLVVGGKVWSLTFCMGNTSINFRLKCADRI